jgi:hypothetical protein
MLNLLMLNNGSRLPTMNMIMTKSLYGIALLLTSKESFRGLANYRNFLPGPLSTLVFQTQWPPMKTERMHGLRSLPEHRYRILSLVARLARLFNTHHRAMSYDAFAERALTDVP